MRKIIAVLATGAVALLAACAPVKPGPAPNGTPFEMAVAGHANNAREANGVPAIGWSNGLADDAQFTVDVCASRNQGEFDLAGCHDITGTPENLIVYGDCDASDARAADAINAWLNSPGHRIFLLDQGGWPPKSAQGVGAVCDFLTGDGQPRLYIAWAGA